MDSALWDAEAFAISSCHQWSRPEVMLTAPSPRLNTMTLLMVGQSLRASSMMAFRGMIVPARNPTSAVMTATLSESWIRLLMDSAENPPKTTEWMAPMRAQAKRATAASGTMGI